MITTQSLYLDGLGERALKAVELMSQRVELQAGHSVPSKYCFIGERPPSFDARLLVGPRSVEASESEKRFEFASELARLRAIDSAPVREPD